MASWTKGQSGNPSGRPRHQLPLAARQKLAELTPKALDALEAALAGETRDALGAAKVVLLYALGPPGEPLVTEKLEARPRRTDAEVLRLADQLLEGKP